MAKLKGIFVKTEHGIFDLEGPSGKLFKIKVEGNKALLVSIDDGTVIGDVYETYTSLNELMKKGQDIVEIRELGAPIRYALFKGVVDDKVATNEGLIDPAYITNYLDYNGWLDTYTRFKFMQKGIIMKVKVKMYGSWKEFRTKREAEETLLDYMRYSDGAEQARYAYAYLSVKDGRKEINTDDEIYQTVRLTQSAAS